MLQFKSLNSKSLKPKLSSNQPTRPALGSLPCISSKKSIQQTANLANALTEFYYSKVLELFEKAVKNQRFENYAKALEQFREVLKLTRKHKLHKNHALENLVYSTYKNLGQIYYGTDDYQKAVEYLLKALSFDSSDSLVTEKVAVCYYKLEKFDESLRFYKKTFDKSSASFNWKSFDKMVECYFILGHVETAVTLSKKGLEIEPRYSRGRLILASQNHSYFESKNQSNMWKMMFEKQQNFTPKLVNDTVFKPETIIIDLKMNCSWYNLIKSFLTVYEDTLRNSTKSFLGPVEYIYPEHMSPLKTARSNSLAYELKETPSQDSVYEKVTSNYDFCSEILDEYVDQALNSGNTCVRVRLFKSVTRKRDFHKKDSTDPVDSPVRKRRKLSERISSISNGKKSSKRENDHFSKLLSILPDAIKKILTRDFDSPDSPNTENLPKSPENPIPINELHNISLAETTLEDIETDGKFVENTVFLPGTENFTKALSNVCFLEMVDNTLTTIAFLNRFCDWPMLSKIQVDEMRRMVVCLIKYRSEDFDKIDLDIAFWILLSIELRLVWLEKDSEVIDETRSSVFVELQNDIKRMKFFLSMNKQIPSEFYHEIILRLSDAESDCFIKLRKPFSAIEALEKCLNNDCRALSNETPTISKNTYHIGSTINRDINEGMLSEKISNLKRNQCVDDVAELFENKKYQEIVNLLEPTIMEYGKNDKLPKNPFSKTNNNLTDYREFINNSKLDVNRSERMKWLVKTYKTCGYLELKVFNTVFMECVWTIELCAKKIKKGALSRTASPVENEHLENEKKWLGLLYEIVESREKLENGGGNTDFRGDTEDVCSLIEILSTVSDLPFQDTSKKNKYLPIYAEIWFKIAELVLDLDAKHGIVNENLKDSLWIDVYQLALKSINLHTNKLALPERAKIMKKTLQKLKNTRRSENKSSENKNSEKQEHNILKEQFIFELYEYPSKPGKAPSRKINVYDGMSVPLIPGNKLDVFDATVIFEYYQPKPLPDFDSFKSSSINSEMANFLTKVVVVRFQKEFEAACVFEKNDDVLNRKKLEDIPSEKTSHVPDFIKHAMYLLADYNLKQKEIPKAIKFYLNDLRINYKRFNSWAGLALAKANQLDEKVRWADTRETNLLKRAELTLYCFERAITCSDKSIDQVQAIYIEYGGIAYWMHSYWSNHLREISENTDISGKAVTELEKMELLQRREDLLLTSEKCYVEAQRLISNQDEWIVTFMQAKVSEKKLLLGLIETKNRYAVLGEIFTLYTETGSILNSIGAKYPKKITYKLNQSGYALESLEVFFRIHVFAEKLCTGKYGFELSETEMCLVRSHLENVCLSSDFAKNYGWRPKKFETESRNLKSQILVRVSEAYKLAIIRFPHNLKGLHRLAKIYARKLVPIEEELLTKHVDPVKNLLGFEQNPLFGKSSLGLDAYNKDFQGIFHNRNKSNIFNGIWRLPHDEIDRPGSFPKHMYRVVKLSIEHGFADNFNDNSKFAESKLTISKLLVEFYQGLLKKPDPKKRYIKEPDRMKCVDLCMKEILKRLKLISDACRTRFEITKDAKFMEGTREALSNIELLAKDAKYGKEVQNAMINVVGSLMFAIGQPVKDESQLTFGMVKQVLGLLKNQQV